MSPALIDCILVFAGGGTGALARYGVQQLGVIEQDKHLYTLAINITGCFLIGLAFALLHHLNAGRAWTLLLMTGFLGGYTTYSTFTLDILQYFMEGRAAMALAYFGITVIGGICTCASALWLVRRFVIPT